MTNEPFYFTDCDSVKAFDQMQARANAEQAQRIAQSNGARLAKRIALIEQAERQDTRTQLERRIDEARARQLSVRRRMNELMR